MAFLSNLTTITSIPLRSFESVLHMNKYQLISSIKKWIEDEKDNKDDEENRKNEKTKKDFFNLHMVECDAYPPSSSVTVIVRGIVVNPLLNDFECFHLLYTFFQHLLVECDQEKIVWTFDGMTHIINRISKKEKK